MKKAILASIIVASAIGLTAMARPEKPVETDNYKYYTNIQLQAGDSLWAIADRYMTDEYKNHQAYIDELVEINQLITYKVDAGTWLVVPYYSSELK